MKKDRAAKEYARLMAATKAPRGLREKWFLVDGKPFRRLAPPDFTGRLRVPDGYHMSGSPENLVQKAEVCGEAPSARPPAQRGLRRPAARAG